MLLTYTTVSSLFTNLVVVKALCHTQTSAAFRGRHVPLQGILFQDLFSGNKSFFFSANHASVAKSLLTTSVVTAIKAFSVKTYKKYNREKLSTGVISKILEERDRL